MTFFAILPITMASSPSYSVRSDSAGKILLANPALVALYGREPAGESIAELFNDPALLDTLLEHGFRLPLREISVNGQTLLLDATPITDAGALLTLYQPNRIGEQLSDRKSVV